MGPFLGYTFRIRKVKRGGVICSGFTQAVSQEAKKSMRAEIRRRGVRNRTDLSLQDIAKEYNPILRGWINYYGRYSRANLEPVLNHFNVTLLRWAMHKYKKLRGHKTRAGLFLLKIVKKEPGMFIHWNQGIKWFA